MTDKKPKIEFEEQPVPYEEWAELRAEHLEQHMEIQKLQSRIQQLEDENQELKWFAGQMNKYVLPGTSDTGDSALKVFNELKDKLAEAEQQILELRSIIFLTHPKLSHVEMNEITAQQGMLLLRLDESKGSAE